jgi:hypothetical protein
MNFKLIGLFVAFVLFSPLLNSFAEEVILDTDTNFIPGEIVEITGVIPDGIPGQLSAIEIKNPNGETILIRTVTLDEDKKYFIKFKVPESSEPGNYDVIVNAENDQGIVVSTKPLENENNEKGGGCLIATATYGSEMANEVQQLRELRDNQLLNTESGTQFIGTFNDIYYSFSPIISDYERENPYFKEAVKLAITPMISSLSLMENANSESEVLGLGLSVIMLNLGMYLGAPAIVIIGIRKKF